MVRAMRRAREQRAERALRNESTLQRLGEAERDDVVLHDTQVRVGPRDSGALRRRCRPCEPRRGDRDRLAYALLGRRETRGKRQGRRPRLRASTPSHARSPLGRRERRHPSSERTTIGSANTGYGIRTGPWAAWASAAFGLQLSASSSSVLQSIPPDRAVDGAARHVVFEGPLYLLVVGVRKPHTCLTLAPAR
jgi:hypothetical protein